ncbi:hypothetical protein KIPB_005803, partial [Kipferlia bialata]
RALRKKKAQVEASPTVTKPMHVHVAPKPKPDPEPKAPEGWSTVSKAPKKDTKKKSRGPSIVGL